MVYLTTYKRNEFKKRNTVSPTERNKYSFETRGAAAGRRSSCCYASFHRHMYSSIFLTGIKCCKMHPIKLLPLNWFQHYNISRNGRLVGNFKAARSGVDARRVHAPGARVLHAIVLWLYQQMHMTISSSPIKKLNFYANWFRPQTTLNFIEENLVYPVLLYG